MAKKTCFVISPIGENGSPTRVRANQIYKYVIAPVLGDGWLVERADLISEPGIITNQIIERLVNSDLVIADLSGRNPNVFYELAVRHIVRKPYVHIIAHDEDIPFDNAPVRAIKIDISDLDSVDFAKEELSAQVSSTMKAGANVESPISVSLSLSEMKRSGDNEGALFQAILSEVSSLRRQQSDLREAVTLLFQPSRNNALYGLDSVASALSGMAYGNPITRNALLDASNASNFPQVSSAKATAANTAAGAISAGQVFADPVAQALAGVSRSKK